MGILEFELIFFNIISASSFIVNSLGLPIFIGPIWKNSLENKSLPDHLHNECLVCDPSP